MELRAIVDGIGDGLSEEGEAGGGDEGANVDVLFLESGADAEVLDALFEEGKEDGVGVRAGDDAFDADAILACGGEDTFHQDRKDFVFQLVRGEGVEDQGGVFAA